MRSICRSLSVHTGVSARPGFFRLALGLSLLALLLAACAPQSAAFDRRQVAAEIDALLVDTVRGPDGELNRNVALLIDAPTLQWQYVGAAGLGRVDSGTPMSADRQFLIASVAKTMTAVIIYQLAESGALGPKGIDTTLYELALLPPEVLAELHRIDGVSYGDSISVRHLLNHTSGMRDLYFDSVDQPTELMPGTPAGAAADSLVGMAAFDPQRGLTALVQCTLKAIPPGCNPDDYLFRYRWPKWDYAAWQANPQNRMAGLLNFYLAGMNDHAVGRPGSVFHYSDTNYLLLDLLIETLTGQSMHQVLRTRIFDRLGMHNTYLIGATEPPAQLNQHNLAEVWAWNEPAFSAGVDFSFDVGAIVSTLEDLRSFARALVDGQFFQQRTTMDQFLSVPADVAGISYASGFISFPTSSGPGIYMLGSNGTWVEYYPPLDLITVGTRNDFSDLSAPFILQGRLFQILANHGLATPMARLFSLPMLLVMITAGLLLLLYLSWPIFLLRGRRSAVSRSLTLARWLTLAALFLNLLLLWLIAQATGSNPFQMLFGFSPRVRLFFSITGISLGCIAMLVLLLALQPWRRNQLPGPRPAMLIAINLLTLVYAASIGVLGV